MATISIRPLDGIMERYGHDLAQLGSPAKVQRVIARAANYEGRKSLTQVRRALVTQTSIPRPVVVKGTRFLPASTGGGGAVQTAIQGTGKPLSLKVFGAKQNASGVTATVWGHRQQFDGGFRGPRPGAIAPRLGGHAFVRTSAKRTPIKKMFGPGIANELIKDQSAAAFRNSLPLIINRVGKEIAAVLRGY